MPSLTRPQSPLAQAQHRSSPPRSAPAATTLTPTFSLEAAADEKTAPQPARSSRSLALRPQERETLTRLLTEKYEYVHHEWFDQPGEEAYRAVFLDPDPVPVPDVSWYHPLMDPSTADPARLVRNVGKNAGSVVLTAAQERVIFTQFNYCRMKVCALRDQIFADDPPRGHTRRSIERQILDWYVRADALRTQIADTNLALVLTMAKRSRIHPSDFADLISEGNMALLRAADKFDVGRGFKFSTYACRAILKAFSRQGIKLSKHRGLFPVDFDPKLERSNYQAEKNAAHEDDCADEVRRIVVDNRADLSDVERTVVAARFNVAPPVPAPSFTQLDPEPSAPEYELPTTLRNRSADAKPLTLEQVGKLIGVTKERVRQIQNKALDKIRLTLEEEYLG
ncbi:MAG: sigma-70 family RNA polymerase sigma factor [Planctomycetota bacterium]